MLDRPAKPPPVLRAPPRAVPQARPPSVTFPFSAIVGQEEMKRALLIAAVDASVGGVLATGDRGTGKTTAVRGLAALLPEQKAVAGCPYGCDPARAASSCPSCGLKSDKERRAVVTPPGPGWSTCRWAPPKTASSARLISKRR